MSKTKLLKQAIIKGNNELIEEYIKEGFDIKKKFADGVYALFLAAENNQLNTAKLLIEKGVDVNSINFGESTALYISAKYGFEKLVKLLVENGANINTKTLCNKNSFPLYVSSKRGYDKIVKFLLDKGANLDLTTSNKSTALMASAKKGNFNILKSLVKGGAKVNLMNIYGMTPLLLASQRGYSEIVKFLLKNGAKIKKNDWGYFPLHSASISGSFETTKKLVNSGADVNQSDHEDSSPLYFACQTGNLKTVKFLISKGAKANSYNAQGASPLLIATLNNHLNVVKYLVKKGANINHLADNDKSALLVSFQEALYPIAEYLINKGADINVRSKEGANCFGAILEHEDLKFLKLLIQNGFKINGDHTTLDLPPIFHACKKCSFKVVESLIQNGANINITSGVRKITPLSIATSRGFLNIVSLLVENGALLNVQTQTGKTPLYLACENLNYKVVQYLLSCQGIDHMLSDSQGITPLLISCVKRDIKSVSELLKRTKHERVNTKDHRGNFPLLIASFNGDLEIVKLLLRFNAKINLYDNLGNFPLLIAAKFGHLEIVKELLKRNPKYIIKNKSAIINSKNIKILQLIENHKTLINNLKRFFENSQFYDLKINKIKIHKVWLQRRTNKKANTNLINFLKKIPKNQLIIFFNWIYTGKIENKRIIRKFAKKFKINNIVDKTIENDLLKLYKDEKSKDFIIFANNVPINVHKFILQARSPFFRKIFLKIEKKLKKNKNSRLKDEKDHNKDDQLLDGVENGVGIDEKEDIYNFKQIKVKFSPQSIKLLIKFLYTNKLNEIVKDHFLDELLIASKLFQLSNYSQIKSRTQLLKKRNIEIRRKENEIEKLPTFENDEDWIDIRDLQI
ncbi:repeat protein [Anaeramoeba flamelloides]|uniref:Repeat protein n=1 Tax=Anaeramoeba flamelloides TaxID=1746091 RepID=A0AAV7YYC7_9EUKA|nr:repeat protein [Anaeramoeba flamelloides]